MTQKASKYTANVVAPPGFTATVSPSTLNVPPHHSRSFTVTITRTTAPIGQWSFGSLTWTDKQQGGRDHSVRSSIAVRPVALAAPNEVTLTGASGSATVSPKVGYTGTLNTAVAGSSGPR